MKKLLLLPCVLCAGCAFQAVTRGNPVFCPVNLVATENSGRGRSTICCPANARAENGICFDAQNAPVMTAMPTDAAPNAAAQGCAQCGAPSNNADFAVQDNTMTAESEMNAGNASSYGAPTEAMPYVEPAPAPYAEPAPYVEPAPAPYVEPAPQFDAMPAQDMSMAPQGFEEPVNPYLDENAQQEDIVVQGEAFEQTGVLEQGQLATQTEAEQIVINELTSDEACAQNKDAATAKAPVLNFPEDFSLLTAPNDKGKAYCPKQAVGVAWNGEEFKCCGADKAVALVPSRGDSICCPAGSEQARWVGHTWKDYECCPAGTCETKNVGEGDRYICCPEGNKGQDGACVDA